MSLRHWIRNSATRVRGDGMGGVRDSAYHLYQGAWRIGCSRLPIGTNVYEREWDVLVVLDGCRTDLMGEVAPAHQLGGDVRSIWSVGSTSREWLAKTFSPAYRDEIAKTAYVTANPYTDDILSPGTPEDNDSPFNPANWQSADRSEFASVEEVWQNGWDDELGTVPPRAVTDSGIAAARKADPDRLILHYMQPHQPFVPARKRARSPEGDGGEPPWLDQNCWRALRDGAVTREELWSAYRENLSYVLEDVDLLRSNVDAERVVLTADHGNALGEWGMYGHPNGFVHPSVKRVPWVETSANDTGDYEPEVAETGAHEQSVDERLESLGYL